ncbi:MAG: methyl-accepting chemotaxis protein [Pseudomonas sp.]
MKARGIHLGRLSISGLLAVGFGLVCSLTMLLAGTALYSMHSILNRQEQMAAITAINSEVLKARVAEKTFQASADPKTIPVVQSIMQEVERALAQSLTKDQRLSSASQEYLSQFYELAKSQEKAESTLTSMNTQAEAVRVEFEVVEQDLIEALGDALTSGVDVESALPLADSAVALMRKLLSVRTSEWAFGREPSQAKYEQWMLLVNDLQSSVQALAAGAGDQQRSSLESSIAALDQYRQAFELYRSSSMQNTRTEHSLDTIAQQMLKESESLQQDIAKSQSNWNKSAYYLLLSMAIAALVFSIAAALFIRREIVKPLRYTALVASEVAEGKLSLTIQNDRQDELGQVMHAMSLMVAKLLDIVRKIGSGSDHIHAATVELARLTSESSGIAQTQSHEADSTATAMIQMNATLQEVAQRTEQTFQAARSAREGAEAGSHDVQAVMDASHQLSLQMDAVSAGIQRLNEQGILIGRVVDVISGMAEQTNLLALNAAIEAARAGEHGRGFSVVADEVRNLANHTQASSREIGAMIESLQTETKDAVEKITLARKLSVETRALSNRANAALDQVALDVATMHEMSSQIASATDQQSQVADSVTRSMVAVRDSTERNHSCNQQLKSASNDLGNLGSGLQEILAYFRLG